MPKLASQFEIEELLAEILEWWILNEDKEKFPEKPRFVQIAEKLSSRLPGTGPCKRGM